MLYLQCRSSEFKTMPLRLKYAITMNQIILTTMLLKIARMVSDNSQINQLPKILHLAKKVIVYGSILLIDINDV